MNNNVDLIEKNRLSKRSTGGTELMMNRLYGGLIPRDLLEQFQIIPSRLEDLELDKYRIYYVHDLVEDPEVRNALGNDGHRRFHAIVAVSNWQAQRMIDLLGVPWSKMVVLQNAIEPLEIIDPAKRDYSTIRLIYASTPHRGLNILLPVFDKLCDVYPNLHLDVFSSFAMYGWKHRDDQYKELFDFMEKHPKITSHGYQSQEVVRRAFTNAHMFTYPSTWKETSSLCLMEAMSAGLVCVHPNYGALFETACNWTHMYNWNEDPQAHAELFYSIMREALNYVQDESIQQRCRAQSVFTNSFYNWKIRARQWQALLTNIINAKLPKDIPPASYVYNY